MSIDAKTVAELRATTGAGMMDAKKALTECDGDLEKAAEQLRVQGIAKAGKRADRATREGRVYAYIHSTGKTGAMVEVQCETDFVAKTDGFGEFCHDLAMHVTAAEPLYLTREDVPVQVVEKEKELSRGEMEGQDKPEDVIEKIVEGKMNKYYSEVCLMEQAYIKDDSKTIEEFLKEQIAALGENIQISRFCRFSI